MSDRARSRSKVLGDEEGFVSQAEAEVKISQLSEQARDTLQAFERVLCPITAEKIERRMMLRCKN